jgi:hypothetical protein
MHLILCYPNGKRVDSLLLAAGRNRLRVAIPQCNETVELRFDQSQWVSDEGDMLEIESMLCDGTTSIPDVAMTAGSRNFYA